MICSHCGSENEDACLYCRECRNLFLGERIEGPLPDEDERILLLAQGCELLKNGEWDLAWFRQWLHEFAVEQERREAQVQAVYHHVPIGLDEDFQEEIDTGFHGVCSVRASLAQLAEYDPDLSSPSTMTNALLLFYKGVCTIKEAMNINRRNRGRPIWI